MKTKELKQLIAAKTEDIIFENGEFRDEVTMEVLSYENGSWTIFYIEYEEEDRISFEQALLWVKEELFKT